MSTSTGLRQCFLLVILSCLTTFAAEAQPCPGGTITGSGCLSGGAWVLSISPFTSNNSLQWRYGPQSTGPFTPLSGATGSTWTTLQSSGCFQVVTFCPLTNTTAYSNVYCLTASTGACQDSVWPGDANYDHIANNNDILAIGLAFGNTGPARAVTGNVYQADFATSWGTAYTTGINMKNADCNGDGVVNWSDTTAVNLNYGLSHPKEIPTVAERGAGLPDLSADMSGVMLVPGHTYTVPIRFGSSGSPVPKFYGLAASLRCSGVALQNAPAITFNASWLGGMNELLRLAHPVNSGQVDFAVVRNTHRDTTGFGPIGNITFTTPATAGLFVLSFQNVTLIDSGGHTLSGYNVVADTANIQPTAIGQFSGDGRLQASISPNPGSRSVINISAASSGKVRLVVSDVSGRRLMDKMLPVSKGYNQFQVPQEEWPAGCYTVEVISDAPPVVMRWMKE